MQRIVFTFFLFCLASSFIIAADTRPNILFIFTDDHAYQAISAYGSNRNKTPNLDRLPAEGMRFTNCCVTNSICGPSRAVIQTGKYSHLNGFPTNNDKFDNTQQTVPKLLGRAGYQTAVVGKWHLECDVTGCDYSEVLIGQGPYYNPPMIRNCPMSLAFPVRPAKAGEGGSQIDKKPSMRPAGEIPDQTREDPRPEASLA